MTITNQDNIKSWSQYSLDDIDKFGDEGDFARQHLLTPTILSLIGDVKRKKILDAGCGTGYLSRKLAKLGAIVTAVEPAKQMYQYNVERENKERIGITYIQEDLSKFKSLVNTFDLVVANMVFLDVPDYQSAMRNCVSALKRSGLFIFSITHPCFEESCSEWLKKHHVAVSEYFVEYEKQQKYDIINLHRTLSSYLNLVIDLDCTIQRVVEPQLAENCKLPQKSFERDIHVPSFLFVKAVKN